MPQTPPKPPAPNPAQLEPGELFAQVKGRLQARGLLGRQVTLELGEDTYRLACAEHSFMVYRVNPAGMVPPGAPGWPVCLLDETRLFEECRAKNIGAMESVCSLALFEWVDLACSLPISTEDE